jgi:hypothetical protein
VDGVAIGLHAETLACPIGKYDDVTEGGPGTELSKMLKRWGITEEAGCECKSRAAKMDLWGPNECERRTDEIVGWMREEAGRRGMPFVEMAARWMVRTAIKRARAASPVVPPGAKPSGDPPPHPH